MIGAVCIEVPGTVLAAPVLRAERTNPAYHREKTDEQVQVLINLIAQVQ